MTLKVKGKFTKDMRLGNNYFQNNLQYYRFTSKIVKKEKSNS